MGHRVRGGATSRYRRVAERRGTTGTPGRADRNESAPGSSAAGRHWRGEEAVRTAIYARRTDRQWREAQACFERRARDYTRAPDGRIVSTAARAPKKRR